MAKECLGDNDHINNKVVINYDLWFSSLQERERIESLLDISRDDSRINIVMKIGYGKSWGSSFDGMKTKKSAQNMQVLDRWEAVKNDPKFIKLCKNEELVEIAKDLGWKKPI
jgi:hypothetical protein